MTCRKNPKLQPVPSFPLEALLVTQPPNVVPPKGNASAQAAILDFLLLLLCRLYFSIVAQY